MTSLRSKILSFILLANELGTTVTLQSILDYVEHHSRSSVEVTLNYLFKNGYVSATGHQGLYHYYITQKGLLHLKREADRKQIQTIKLTLEKLESCL